MSSGVPLQPLYFGSTSALQPGFPLGPGTTTPVNRVRREQVAVLVIGVVAAVTELEPSVEPGDCRAWSVPGRGRP